MAAYANIGVGFVVLDSYIPDDMRELWEDGGKLPTGESIEDVMHKMDPEDEGSAWFVGIDLNYTDTWEDKGCSPKEKDYEDAAIIYENVFGYAPSRFPRTILWLGY